MSNHIAGRQRDRAVTDTEVTDCHSLQSSFVTDQFIFRCDNMKVQIPLTVYTYYPKSYLQTRSQLVTRML
jgi:hypothetical protein